MPDTTNINSKGIAQNTYDAIVIGSGILGYQVGGRSLTWGRTCARWSPYDVIAAVRYGYWHEY